MVKVVEQAASKRFTCGKCGSILEYGYHDVTEEYIRDCGGGGDTYYRVLCPVCLSKNNVSRWKT